MASNRPNLVITFHTPNLHIIWNHSEFCLNWPICIHSCIHLKSEAAFWKMKNVD